MFLSIENERKKTAREANFEPHYIFICLHNKCMTGLRTDGRTYVRTYAHDVITKFSELQGLLPFSLTNGCSAPRAFDPLEELRYKVPVNWNFVKRITNIPESLISFKKHY